MSDHVRPCKSVCVQIFSHFGDILVESLRIGHTRIFTETFKVGRKHIEVPPEKGKLIIKTPAVREIAVQKKNLPFIFGDNAVQVTYNYNSFTITVAVSPSP